MVQGCRRNLGSGLCIGDEILLSSCDQDAEFNPRFWCYLFSHGVAATGSQGWRRLHQGLCCKGLLSEGSLDCGSVDNLCPSSAQAGEEKNAVHLPKRNILHMRKARDQKHLSVASKLRVPPSTQVSMQTKQRNVRERPGAFLGGPLPGVSESQASLMPFKGRDQGTRPGWPCSTISILCRAPRHMLPIIVSLMC